MDREFDGNAFVGLLKKIDEILKRGVVRGEQKYNFNSAFAVNCMGHAIFNFKNEDIEKLSIESHDELRNFFWLFERVQMAKHRIPPKMVCKKAEQDLLDKVHLAGLEIEECDKDDDVSEGQFKVAYYFDFTIGKEDFHFVRQEPDGTWSSKMGMSLDVDKFSQLPKRFNDYELVKVFKVTNPYIYKEVDEKN